MNYDFSAWVKLHQGHTLNYGFDSSGKQFVVCLNCGVSCDVEAISAKISPADCYKTVSDERQAQGKLSPGVPFGGVK